MTPYWAVQGTLYLCSNWVLLKGVVGLLYRGLGLIRGRLRADS